ncbi:MAG TPA: DNA polymerase [Methylocella sp.]|nr:DNA polymerase [Methylocella sp.]
MFERIPQSCQTFATRIRSIWRDFLSLEEAGACIKRYFERFPGIRTSMDETNMDETKKFLRENMSPRSLAANATIRASMRQTPMERAFNERAAIKAPLQGSAADIIRRAIIRMDAALAKAKLSAKMLLQVHDELVFEAPGKEVEATIEVVRKIMTDAPHPAVTLKVPLQVDAKAAQNWDEAH